MFRSKPNALEDASLEDLYAEVLGPNEIDDVLVEFDDGDPAAAVGQLEAIAAAMDVSRDDIQRAKRRQIETGFWNELAGKAMKRLGIGPKGESS